MEIIFQHLYFCRMDIHLTPAEAWADFWQWIKQQPQWKDKDKISRNEKQALYKANRAAQGRDNYPLGIRRIERILNQYAEGRYTFIHHTTVTLNEK